MDTLLSESRKFNAGICTANQFLDQYPASMRSAILSAGTHVLFQLASQDADRMGSALGGGKSLAALLKNLPQRHMVVNSGHHHPVRAVVPESEIPSHSYQDLYNRSRERWARRRSEVEAEIRGRALVTPQAEQRGLHGWN